MRCSARIGKLTSDSFDSLIMPRKSDGAAADPRWRSHIEPAPGELRIVQALINTAVAGREELSNSRALVDWLRHWGLLSRSEDLDAADLERVLEVRSDFAALIRSGQDRPPAPEVTARLNRLAAASPLWARFSSAGSIRFEPSVDGVFEALARLFEIVVLAHYDQRWRRLKLCQRPVCGAAFYDFSPASSGRWCSARCGDRLKSRAYRERRKRYQARTRGNRPLAQ